MTKLYYQFPNTWFGDCMPFGKGDQFYLFHQRDTRKPCPFGEPFGWDLAVTSDFVHYEDKGTALPRGTDEEQDQFILQEAFLKQRESITFSIPDSTGTIQSWARHPRC